jgi:hypothetical protein
LHGHESARNLIGHRTSLNLLFYSLKKLHSFRRYWYFKNMRGFLDYLYIGQHTRKNVKINMICSTRSTRYTFWSFLIVQNGWNLVWLPLNSIPRAKRLPFFHFQLHFWFIDIETTLKYNFQG